MPHIFIPPEFQHLEKDPQLLDFQPRFGISNPDFGFPTRPDPDRPRPTRDFGKSHRPGPTRSDPKKGDAKPKKGTQKGTHPFSGVRGPRAGFSVSGAELHQISQSRGRAPPDFSKFRISVLKLAYCSLGPHTVHAHEPIQLELDPLKAWVQLWQRPDLLLQVLPYRCTSY